MYSIVIADDESIERIGLRKLLKANFPDNLTIVGEATNGLQVLDLCAEVEPDLLIIDIKMPDLNGIEAAKVLHDRKSKTRVIISSAYSDYAYMNTAILIGVDAYLLKPYSLDQFSQAIDTAIEKIVIEKQQQKTRNQLLEKLSDAAPLVESQFAMLAIHGYLTSDAFFRLNRIMEKDFSRGVVVVFGIENSFSEDPLAYPVDDDFSVKEIANYLYGEMNRKYDAVLSVMSPSRMLMLISSKGHTSQLRMEGELNLLTDHMIREIQTSYRELLHVGISEPYTSIKKIGVAFAHAVAQVKSSIANDQNKRVNQIETFSNSQKDHMHWYPNKSEHELLLAIKLGDLVLIETSLNQLFDWLDENYEQSDNFDSTALYANSLLAAIQKQIAETAAVNTSLQIYNLHVYEIFTSIDQLMIFKQALLDAIKEAMAYQENLHEEKNQRIVARIEKFIASHYYMDLSLVDMAESVNYTPPYFCKIFKEFTGKGFVKYLTQIRLNEANALLESSDLKINEIAFKVGYNNPNYFLRVYKKYHGFTPSEYRNKV